MAAAVVEALRAAEAAGQADWLREHVAAELAAADADTAKRLEQGSYQHARRRAHEMARPAKYWTSWACRPGSPGPASTALEELVESDRPARPAAPGVTIGSCRNDSKYSGRWPHQRVRSSLCSAIRSSMSPSTAPAC